MAIWDHWHPVYPSKRLRSKPVGVTLGGREIVLFRGQDGAPAALDDCCPHRRMRLSAGTVCDGRLVCCYHGWSYTSDGAGESPGTPKLHATANSFYCQEAHDFVWLRAKVSERPMPPFDIDGHFAIAPMTHVVNAPLELVVDNFTEVEHTPTTHALLGYPIERMAEVETRVESSADRVRVFNAGPQKNIGRFFESLFGIKAGDRFVDDWTTYFSPVHSRYDQYWSDAKSGAEHGLRFRIYVFFVPVTETRTMVVTFPFLRRAPTMHSRMARWKIAQPILRGAIDREVRLDVATLEKLADKSPSMEGMKLSRFDKVLGLHRDRINSIYRGAAPIALARRGADGRSSPHAISIDDAHLNH